MHYYSRTNSFPMCIHQFIVTYHFITYCHDTCTETNTCTLTLLNGLTLMATLTQSLLYMSDALPFMVQQEAYQHRRLAD